jgi:hypothetical protein
MALSKISAASITSNVISSALIADGEITFADIANNTITGDKIASTATLANLNVSGATTFLSSTLESANITTAMSATLDINIAQPYVVFTANSAANSTVNFTGLAGVSVGNSATFIVVVPNSSTAKYISTYQVDGSGTTVKWAGGAPIGGTSANTDVYSFVVIKTAATPTYNILAQVSSYY